MIGKCVSLFFFFQAEDGIRDLVRSRGLGDVYKRQREAAFAGEDRILIPSPKVATYDLQPEMSAQTITAVSYTHLTLPTSDLV